MALPLLLPGLRRSLLLTTPLLLATPLIAHNLRFQIPQRHLIRCDGSDPFSKIADDLTSSSRRNEAPLLQSGALNPRAVRQISMGSVLGVLGGLGVSVFSKPLAVLIGLGVVFVQFIESRGFHIIPYSYLQRRFKGANVRSLVRNNVAFKLSFGLTFALAAFAEF